jgi:hypothetical protein
MTLLIGLHGRRGAGKDTAFGLLHEWLAERGQSSARRGFADALKFSFARMFVPSMTLEEAVIWCDELKLDYDTGHEPSAMQIKWGGPSQDGTVTHVSHTITGRQALQRFGTECHRDIFGINFWTDALLPLDGTMTDFPDGIEKEGRVRPSWPFRFRGPLVVEPPDVAFVTDTRFPNEAERIRELGGKVWKIVRTPVSENEDPHSSEIPLPDELVDQEINSPSGDLDRFRQNLIDAFNEDFS